MKIRLEERTDFKEVEYVAREAFWNIYRPGCYEHLIIHNLRHDPSFISQLDYVLEEDEKIIGHIAYSKNTLIKYNKNIEVVTLGPVSILPEYQNKGYGTKLIEYTLEKAKQQDIPCIFVIGDEKYYQRFGFENTSKYNIKYNELEGPTPFFMINVFDETKMDELQGIYKDNPLFQVDNEELEEFDKKFPPKKKERRKGHLNF